MYEGEDYSKVSDSDKKSFDQMLAGEYLRVWLHSHKVTYIPYFRQEFVTISVTHSHKIAYTVLPSRVG